jgi:hypothetical protein
LEELWDLEDRYPVDSNSMGLMRWLAAPGFPVTGKRGEVIADGLAQNDAACPSNDK